jgi:hypothetical protein
MPSRWDAILDLKPVPIREHLLEELGRLFAQDLEAWPPSIEEPSPEVSALLQATPERPAPRLFRQAFVLARWELEHDLLAFDDYVRNQRWREQALPDAHKPMLLFLSRYLVEQLDALTQATDGRINQKARLEVLARTQARLLPPQPKVS